MKKKIMKIISLITEINATWTKKKKKNNHKHNHAFFFFFVSKSAYV